MTRYKKNPAEFKCVAAAQCPHIRKPLAISVLFMLQAVMDGVLDKGSVVVNNLLALQLQRARVQHTAFHVSAWFPLYNTQSFIDLETRARGHEVADSLLALQLQRARVQHTAFHVSVCEPENIQTFNSSSSPNPGEPQCSNWHSPGVSTAACGSPGRRQLRHSRLQKTLRRHVLNPKPSAAATGVTLIQSASHNMAHLGGGSLDAAAAGK